jgi:hypothetical protein
MYRVESDASWLLALYVLTTVDFILYLCGMRMAMEGSRHYQAGEHVVR